MISIIVPIYNAEKYLSESLRSLQNQSYSDFEVVCVNDGSIDRSAKICKEFSDVDHRFIYCEQLNGGVSKARNKGLEISSGELICFLDADDTLPEYTLELFTRFAKSHDTVVGYTIRGGGHLKPLNKEIVTHEGIEYILNDYLFNNTRYQFCSFLYRKDIIDKTGLRFSDDLKYGEDEEFAWKYLSHCNSSITLETDLYNYRDNLESASHKISYSRNQVIDTMVRVYDYYKLHNHFFSSKIKRYGIPKAKLSILKQFAENQRLDLYNKLSSSSTYNISVLPLLLFPNFKIKLAAMAYSISPKMFYKLLSR